MSAPAARAVPAPAPPALTYRGDAAEVEADRMASRALDFRQPAPAAPQRSQLPNADPGPLPSLPAPGGGRPLERSERDGLGARFGRDLGAVRVHDDAGAASAARALDARAFTRGRDIYFAAGAYQPGSVPGRGLLAHELAHAVQDRPGVVARREADAAPEAAGQAAGAADRVAQAMTEDPQDRAGTVRRMLRGLSAAERAAVVQEAGAKLGPAGRGALAALALEVAQQDAPQARPPGTASAPTATAPPTASTSASPPAADAAPPVAAAEAGATPQAEAVPQPGAGPAAPPPAEIAAPEGGEGEAEQEGGDALPPLAELLEPLPPTMQQEAGAGPTTPGVGVGMGASEGMGGGEVAPPAPSLAARGAMGGQAADPTAGILAAQGDATSRIHASGAATKATLHARAGAMRGAVTREVAQASDALHQRFAGARVMLEASILSAHAQIDTQLVARRAEAATRGEQAGRDYAGVFATHRSTMEGTVARALVGAEALRARYAARVTARSGEQAAEARNRGRLKASGYPGTERGGIQSSAATGVADGVAAEIESRAPEAVAAVDEVLQPLPEQFRTKGQEALQGFDQGLPELQTGATGAATEAQEALSQLAAEAHQMLEASAVTMRAELAEAEAAAADRLAALEPAATGQIDTALRAALRGVDAALPDAIAPVDGYAGEAAAILAGIEAPDPAAAAAFGDTVSGLLLGMAAEAEAAFGEAAASIPDQFSATLPPLRQGLRAIGKETDKGVQAALDADNTALSGFVGQVDDAYGKRLVELGQAYTAGQEEVGRRLAPATAGLEADFRKTLTESETRIRENVEAALAKNDEALRDMGGVMDEAASDAAWDYDHPVLSTLRDIGLVIAGVIVGILAVIVLVVVVIVAAKIFVAMLVAAGVAAATAKLIVAIGLIGYAVYQGYKAYSAHREAGSSWYGALGRTAADMTGLTAIHAAFTQPGLTPYQRGKSFGEGAATLVATFLGVRKMTQRFRARTPPQIPNPARGAGGAGAASPPAARPAALPPAEPVAPPAAAPAAPVAPAPVAQPAAPVVAEPPVAAQPKLSVLQGGGQTTSPPRGQLASVSESGALRPATPKPGLGQQAVPQQAVVAEAAGAEGMAPRPATQPGLGLAEPTGRQPIQAMASGGKGGGPLRPSTSSAPVRAPNRAPGGSGGRPPARAPAPVRPSGGRGGQVRPPPTTRPPVSPPVGQRPGLRPPPGARPAPAAAPKLRLVRPPPKPTAPARPAPEPGLETRGYRPKPGERLTTREGYKAQSGRERWQRGVERDVDRMFEGKEPSKPPAAQPEAPVSKPGAPVPKPGASVPAPARTTVPIGQRVQAAVDQGIRDVRTILGKRWARRPEFGTRLHAAVKARLQGLRLPRGWRSQADQPLRNFPGADPRVMRLTVRQWFAENPHLEGLRDSLPPKILNQVIGDMRADLLVRGPQGQTAIWDLTSISQQEHLAKTMLYGHLMAPEGAMIRFAETYWVEP
jgi:hypothetical protein